MKTLVYFASGPESNKYKNLDFDKIYLIDNCFKGVDQNNFFTSPDKIIRIGMDCLESIYFLKKHKIKIDYFVSLNEGLIEGGGTYAINSDVFLGYVMPLLKQNYIHIMNKNYYRGHINFCGVSMDLPYSVEEIKENDPKYISPNLFSTAHYHKGYAKIFQMKKLVTKKIEINLTPKIKLTFIHDSIWNYYDYLDALFISFSNQFGSFFENIPKVYKFNKNKLIEVFEICKNKKIQKIGFIPWAKGNYKNFIDIIKGQKSDYLSEVFLFHLNRNDFKEIKNSFGKFDVL